MMAWWLALLIAAGGPQIECALVIPQPGDLGLDRYNVAYDAESGLTLVSQLRPETVAELFDGRLARFVVAGSTSLSAEPGVIRLSLASGELTYVALRDGHPITRSVPNPAAVTLTASGQSSKAGMDLRLKFEVVRLTGQSPVPAMGQAEVGEPTFTRRNVELDTTTVYDTPFLVLLESAASLQLQGEDLEVTFRRRVGAQTVESMAPLLGLVVRLVPPGGLPQYHEVQPPLAPPGTVRVVGDVKRPGTVTYQAGLSASQVLQQAGVDEQAEVTMMRQDSRGAVEQVDLGQGLPNPSVKLQDRDTLYVGRAAQQQQQVQRPQRPQAAEGAPGAGGAGGPAGPPGAPKAAPLPPPMPAQQQQAAARAMPLEEVQQVAPAAAAVTRAVVAVRAHQSTGKGQRQVLMSGTIVRPNGLILTAPAQSLAEAEDITVQLSTGAELPARKVNVDATGAVLALKIDLPGPLPYLPLADGFPEPGTAVLVVGHPYGLLRSLALTVVGGPRRKLAGNPGVGLQLDGALAQGNAGGPVVDLNGRLLGLAYGTLQVDEPGPAVGFAVPVDVLRTFLQTLPVD